MLVALGSFARRSQCARKMITSHPVPTASATGQSPPADAREAFTPLSPREMEILEYVTRGLSNKEIAYKLGISHQTVKNHMTAILQKLDGEDRTQAAIYAVKHGWVRLQDNDGKPDIK